jgi:hypothetical protein
MRNAEAVLGIPPIRFFMKSFVGTGYCPAHARRADASKDKGPAPWTSFTFTAFRF